MEKIIRQIVKSNKACWNDPRTIFTKPVEKQAKIEQAIAINKSSSTKKIRIGLKTSEADVDKNPIMDRENVEKDTPISIGPIYLEEGDSIYAIFTGAEKDSDLTLLVHGEYIDS